MTYITSLTRLLSIFKINFQQKNKTIISVKLPMESKKKVFEKKNAVLVDVRNPKEIQESHCDRPFVAGKYLLEENCDEGRVQDDLPDKDAPHIVFCAKGGRAGKACRKLKNLGYEYAYNAGGLEDLDWLE